MTRADDLWYQNLETSRRPGVHKWKLGPGGMGFLELVDLWMSRTGTREEEGGISS